MGSTFDRDHASARRVPERQEGLRIQLLGGFQVAIGDQVIGEAEWRLRKARSLVKLLALAPNHQLHREQVMDTLWPDLDPQAASNNLRKVLHIARRAMGSASPAASQHLQMQDDLLTLGSTGALWVDIEAFEVAATAAHSSDDPAVCREAIRLYTGDLLPQDRYEDWTIGPREQLRTAYLTLLVKSARLYEGHGEFDQAIETLRRVITADAVNEEAHVGLMRLYALAEQHHQALRQYGQLQEALKRELDAEPEETAQHLYREIHAGRFPAERSRIQQQSHEMSGARDHNIPIQLTSFVGREREIAEVKRLLSRTRLLTLTGVGGCGKTRLALETVTGLLGEYLGGVWLVELAALFDPALVPHAVASTLGVRERPVRPLIETLSSQIQSKRLLLVLDNCEHLVAACAQLSDTLLRACPELRVLATSREALNIPGEVVWLVPSLSLPGSDSTPAADLEQYEAVRLFTDRAGAALLAFSLTSQNATVIAQICRRLDGIPLAIELAAARVRVLSAQQIAHQLDDCFRLLSGGSRTALPRLQTLSATIGWSYDLLSVKEQVLFRRLSLFAGGFSLEAAEAVCAASVIEGPEVLDLVSRLVDKSLVMVSEFEGGGEMRYRLLETLRQYGRNRLREKGEMQEIEQRYAQYYLALSEEAEPELRGPRQVMWFDRLDREHDNLRAVLGSALVRGGGEIAARLAGALWRFWETRGYHSEGRGWLDRVLAEETGAPATLRAKAFTGAGFLAYRGGDYPLARSLYAKALALYRESGDKHGIAVAFNYMVDLYDLEGDLDRAILRLEENLALCREAGYERGVGRVLNGLGEIARRRHDYVTARERYKGALVVYGEVGDTSGATTVLHNMGHIALLEGDWAEAARLFSESLTTSLEIGRKLTTAFCLAGLAGVAGGKGQPRRAGRLFGAAERLMESLGDVFDPVDQESYDRSLASARAQLDEESWEAAWAEGRAMTMEQAIEEAMPLHTPTRRASLS